MAQFPYGDGSVVEITDGSECCCSGGASGSGAGLVECADSHDCNASGGIPRQIFLTITYTNDGGPFGCDDFTGANCNGRTSTFTLDYDETDGVWYSHYFGREPFLGLGAMRIKGVCGAATNEWTFQAEANEFASDEGLIALDDYQCFNWFFTTVAWPLTVTSCDPFIVADTNDFGFCIATMTATG